jgi:hypothetical protein
MTESGFPPFLPSTQQKAHSIDCSSAMMDGFHCDTLAQAAKDLVPKGKYARRAA